MSTCKDCKGRGVIQLLTSVVECELCGGKGGVSDLSEDEYLEFIDDWPIQYIYEPEYFGMDLGEDASFSVIYIDEIQDFCFNDE